MIKQSFLKKLKGMPVDVAMILINHKGYSTGPYIQDVLSLHPKKNTVLLSQKDGIIIKAKAADILDLE